MGLENQHKPWKCIRRFTDAEAAGNRLRLGCTERAYAELEWRKRNEFKFETGK